MDNKGYFFVDGSHLLSSVYSLQRVDRALNKKKVDINILTDSLSRLWSLHTGTTIRTTYYFKKNEERLKKLMVIPDSTVPGLKDHWQIKSCGENVRGKIPQKELEKITPRYREYFPRAEKGLDTRLVCDSLMMLTTGKVSNLVFLVNDRDYVPLFETVQALGGNVYLTGLSDKLPKQRKLSELADKYLTLDDYLNRIFGISNSEIEKNKPQQL